MERDDRAAEGCGAVQMLSCLLMTRPMGRFPVYCRNTKFSVCETELFCFTFTRHQAAVTVPETLSHFHCFEHQILDLFILSKNNQVYR